MKVVITDNRFGDADLEREVLESRGIEVVTADCASSSDVASAGREADGLLVNLAPVDAAALEALPRCRVVSRYGIGLDNIDLAAATRLGIVVKNVPGYCDREVAEHAMGLLLAAARAIPARDRAVRAGEWNLVPPGRRIAGSSLGILGFGSTARALVRLAAGFGFSRISIWSPHIDKARVDAEFGILSAALGIPIAPASFDEVLENADWLSIHLPLKPETRSIIGSEAIARMKWGAVLVNVARGPLVDEDALLAALESGRLGGAGLDVFSVEPLPPNSPLRSAPNLVMTDHAAYASVESIRELRRRCAENVLEILAPS